MGRNGQFVVVCAVLSFYMIGLLGALPAFALFLVQRRCREMGAADCGSDDVQASATDWNMYCMLIVNFTSMLMNAYLGAVSDRYGRRPVLLVGLIGAVVWAFVNFAVCAFDLPLWITLPFWFVIGLTGGMGTILSC